MAIPNRWPGRCVCGQWVAADAGVVKPLHRRMQVYCGPCTPAPLPATWSRANDDEPGAVDAA